MKSGMENFTLNTIVDYARTHGIFRIVCEYLPTAKNQMVEEHYPRLGFCKIEGVETAQYELLVESYQVRECYIKSNYSK